MSASTTSRARIARRRAQRLGLAMTQRAAVKSPFSSSAESAW
jgi:hypothetical protein